MATTAEQPTTAADKERAEAEAEKQASKPLFGNQLRWAAKVIKNALAQRDSKNALAQRDSNSDAAT